MVLYCRVWFGSVWFYGTSTIVGYLMPNPFLYILTVLFQTIQFSLSTQFSSIWPIDKTLSGATTPSLSGPRNDDNEGILHIPQNSSITGTSPSDIELSRRLLYLVYSDDFRQNKITWAPFVELKEPPLFATLWILDLNSSVLVSSEQSNCGSWLGWVPHQKESQFMKKIVLVATTRTQKETSNTFDSCIIKPF